MCQISHVLYTKQSTFKREFKNKFSNPHFLYNFFLFNGCGRPKPLLILQPQRLCSFFIQQRFGIKLWFTEALRFIFNRLQPILAKIVANYCYLSFQFGLLPRKKYFLQLLQFPGLSQLLVDVRFLPLMWVLQGILLLCVVTQSPYRPCHYTSDATFTRGPSLTLPQTVSKREQFCPDIHPHLECCQES